MAEPDHIPGAVEGSSPGGGGVERDLRLILAIQAARAFLYGFGSVLIGSSLAAGGLSDARVGLVFTAMLVGMAVVSIGVGLVGDRAGRRRMYAVLLGVMGVAGAAFALTRWLPALIVAAMSGTLSTDPNESGPITTMEQAMIGQAPAAARVRVFGRYNAIAYLFGAVGSLAAGGPAAFHHLIPSLPSSQRFLLAFPVVAAVCVALARRLSGSVEPTTTPDEAGRRSRPLTRSRRTVAKLSALFAMDAGAGGFVVQAFLAFWFQRKFGAGPEVMGLVLFGAGLLQAGSSILAARLAGRIGLLNTMVFTHLPSNVLLAAIAFAPNLGVAIALLLARFALSQMDVPARQAYVMAMVDPQERTAAAAYTNTARYVVRPAGAAGAGVLMQHVSIGAPFVAAGGLKILYDLALFGVFRRVPVPEPD
jgi:predicted MFS family arabinose efflux permease